MQPSPGPPPPRRGRPVGATAEKLPPALSRLSYSRRPHALPCNRQERSLEEGTTPPCITASQASTTERQQSLASSLSNRPLNWSPSIYDSRLIALRCFHGRKRVKIHWFQLRKCEYVLFYGKKHEYLCFVDKTKHHLGGVTILWYFKDQTTNLFKYLTD